MAVQDEFEASRAATTPLLGRVARGEASAFKECIAVYGRLVWAMARRLAPAEAEDAVQEIFLDLWKSAGRFDPAIASEQVFVAMIARRRLLDRRRRATHRPEGPAEELATVKADTVPPDRGAEASLAMRTLEHLRPEQREVLVLSACHGLSHDEIAQKTGMPLGTVKAHARRGLLRIRAELLHEDLQEEDAS